jgi:hypothetical protein
MNSGLLVVIALFLIYLAVSGKYACVTAASKCLFQGAALCECGPKATAKTPVAGMPTGLDRAIQSGRELYDRLRGIIGR